jgi:hypothetical protein
MFGSPWVLLLLIVGGFFLYRYYQNLEPAAQGDFQASMLQDSARYLGPMVGLGQDDTVAGLEAILAGNTPPAELAVLQRIEYVVIKEAADRACRTLLITTTTPDGPATGKVHRRMGWDSLPAKIKDQFVVASGNSLTFVLLDRSPKQLV